MAVKAVSRVCEVHEHMPVGHIGTQCVLDAHHLRAGHVLDPSDGRLSGPAPTGITSTSGTCMRTSSFKRSMAGSPSLCKIRRL
eukprot:5260030-Amphidinium_carterae.1